MPLTQGARIDRYEVLAPLGQGAMGVVYRARDARLGREVAIKVLPAAFSADPERLRRFDQEARAAGSLNHPNVLTIYDVGTHEGEPYVVSELLEGGTLRARIAAGGLPVRKVLDYGVQIARGLAAAHAKGIIHRDLKPENLFVTRDGQVKILDFGLAKLTRLDEPALGGSDSINSTLTQAGAIMGTAGYMAPEQVQGLATDHRSDIFSLGCVLYEMATGERAFTGNSPVETLYAIVRNDLADFPRHVSSAAPGLIPVVRRCVEKSPSERFESARDLAFGLEVLGGFAGKETKPAEEAAAPAPAAAQELSYHRITFRRGVIWSARFTPDEHSVVYSGAWEGQAPELFSARIGNPESGTLGYRDADLFAISPTGEMGVMLRLKFVSSFDRRGTLARIPPLGGAARELLHDVHGADWSPDGTQLAVARDKDGMMRLEYPIGHLLYQTAGWVGEMRVSRDGNRVAFLDHATRTSDEGAVVIVDRNGDKRVLTEGWGTLRGACWSADGREVWFTADRGGAARGLYAVDLEGRVRRVLQVASNLTIHDIARDGRVLVSHGPERAGISGRAPGESRERDLSWLDWSLLHDLTADGRMMLLSESSEGGGELGSVYVRPTDGSPAVRIGHGTCFSISPDGEWVLARQSISSGLLYLLPTGVGEPREVAIGDLRVYSAVFLPDGKSLALAASAPGKGTRLYHLDLAGGEPRAFSPEGLDAVELRALPHRGDVVAGFTTEQGYRLYPVDGGEPQPVPGLERDDRLVRWSADGSALFVWRYNQIPARVHRIDVESGERTLWRELTPPDPTGIYRIGRLHISADGGAYAYTYYLHLIDLHVIEGLS